MTVTSPSKKQTSRCLHLNIRRSLLIKRQIRSSLFLSPLHFSTFHILLHLFSHLNSSLPIRKIIPFPTFFNIVEIPVVEQEKPEKNELTIISSAIQQHPMMEISKSPGHFLLLKLWQREEDLFARKITMKETKLDSIRREIFQLCCFFFLFHALFSTILFISSVDIENDDEEHMKCRKWWIPSVLSILTSMAVAVLVQGKLHWYWKVAARLRRETGDNRALTRCIQELRMKGDSFDLSKEPQINGKRIKSSSVEIKWKPITWFTHYFVTLCLVLFAALAFPAPKLFLCIF